MKNIMSKTKNFIKSHSYEIVAVLVPVITTGGLIWASVKMSNDINSGMARDLDLTIDWLKKTDQLDEFTSWVDSLQK